MCGIATITLAKTANSKLDLNAAVTALLAELDSRGGDATGMLTISAGGHVEVQKAVCAAEEFNHYRSPVKDGTRALMVHTRLATQGPQSFNRNNHPVISGRAYVVHNGVLWENMLRRSGDPEVDTYALAMVANANAQRHKRESAIDHGKRIAAESAKLDGSAAIGVAFRSQAFLVTAKLAGSPLWVAEAEGVRVCASTEAAVSDAFFALGIDLPGFERTIKDKGQDVLVWEEEIEECKAGEVFTWDAGMHSHGSVPVANWATRSYGGGLWDDEYRYEHSDYVKPYANDLDSIAKRVLDANLAADLRRITSRDFESEDEATAWERCETCDTYHWAANMVDRWDMTICRACEAAFIASGATDDALDEVGADATP
jgi:asparagine synthetase B (glutamine-hydrolysing)